VLSERRVIKLEWYRTVTPDVHTVTVCEYDGEILFYESPEVDNRNISYFACMSMFKLGV
jgi:hypothetical protein